MTIISVIVPIYNAEKKLTRCIQSILNQTISDFELILVDDGSPDNCGAICDEYAEKDRRIVVIHQKNSGASAARNAGIAAAHGKYIGFIDSDDYISDNYFECLVNTAIEKETDIVMCNYTLVDKNGNMVNMFHGFITGTVFSRDQIENTLYKNIFNNENTVGYFSLCNKIFKKDFIKKNDIIINENMFFGEDMLFIMDCLQFCESIAFIENAGYNYEMTEDGLFSKYRRSFINDISICYNRLIDQTAPKGYNQKDLVPISIKYWNYINRQITAIAKNESQIFNIILCTLHNQTVKKIFSVIASISSEKAKFLGIMQNELKPAKLLKNNHHILAAIVADYQFNSKFWLRRIRH